MKTAKLATSRRNAAPKFEECWKEDHDAIMDGLDKMEFSRLVYRFIRAI